MKKITSRIELRFGLPSSVEREELVAKRAIEHSVSIERVLCVDFRDMLTEVWMQKGRENIFELLIFIHAKEKVVCSDVRFGTYMHNGFRYPKAIIQSDYLNIVNSDKRLWLSDEVINLIGKDLDENFDFEYVDFLRVKK